MSTPRITEIMEYVNLFNLALETGEVFGYCINFSINSGATKYLTFTTGNKIIRFKPATIRTDKNNITIEFYKNSTVTGVGTSIPINKRNLNSNISTTATIKTDQTPTNIGDKFYYIILFGSTGLGNTLYGETNSFEAEFILSPNTTYVTKVINNGAETCNIYAETLWSEK